MDEMERRVCEVLRNLNWLLEPHNSFVELVEVKGKIVIIRCVGSCAACRTDCIGTAFRERLPYVELIVQ